MHTSKAGEYPLKLLHYLQLSTALARLSDKWLLKHSFVATGFGAVVSWENRSGSGINWLFGLL